MFSILEPVFGYFQDVFKRNDNICVLRPHIVWAIHSPHVGHLYGTRATIESLQIQVVFVCLLTGLGLMGDAKA